jgi:alpha-beta hydrolase superfamily lysophospholipase
MIVLRTLFRLCRWGLAAMGLLALLLVGSIAVPLSGPPMLESVSRAARAVDRSDMPVASQFQARDGTALSVRHYPARAVGVTQIAVLVHGSSGSSPSIHALARALAEHGVETYSPDIRGHGLSGTRGDIGYAGQLQDDLADLVGFIRRSHPSAPLVLIGHSAGGGFALRMAGSPIQDLFVRTVLLAPYLGYRAPTNFPDSGGWARGDLPRFIGLSVLRRLEIPWAESLPTLAFAVPPHSEQVLAATYSYRLMRDFAASQDFRDDLAAARHPVAIFSGADDELMISAKYQDAVGDRVPVRIVPGVDHMGIVSDSAAVSAIANDVAKVGASS